MAKRYIVAHPIPTANEVVSGPNPIDWQKCIFCQSTSAEKLVCPANSKRSDCSTGYISLAEILPQFVQADLLPAGFYIERLDDGSGLENTLISNKAKWHKHCRMFYYSTELNRAAKRIRCASPVVEGEYSMNEAQELNVEHSSFRRSMSSDTRKSSLVYTLVCFICDNIESKDSLHSVSTTDLDMKVRECAMTLCDSTLLTKLSDSDLIAQEAKYHTKCLNDLYNKKRAFNRRMRAESQQQDNETDCVHGVVFAQLIAYIEETRSDNDNAPIFKLADLSRLYADRLSQLTEDRLYPPTQRMHSTRLKERLQAHFPNMCAQQEGRDVLLVFNDDIGPALLKACQYDCDRDAVYLSKAAQIIRQSIFNSTEPFAGEFQPGCQERSVSQNLLALVTMILEGPSIDIQTKQNNTPAALTISQLLTFNSVKHKRSEKCNSYVDHTRRSQSQETPLPLYVSLLVHATTRKRSIIDELFHLGLCVSYDRILALTTELGNDVCDQYNSDQVVCPLKLRRQLFTVAAVDNIDHNPTSTTAHGAYHGTAISLAQQPDNFSSGVPRDVPLVHNRHGSKKIKPLPESYSDVPPVRLKNEQPAILVSSGPFTGSGVLWEHELNKEQMWLETVKQVHDGADASNDNMQSVEWFSWSAYHANMTGSSDINLSIVSLLPLFQDSSNSVAMIRHSMDVIKNSIHHLNPEQIPVITFDQPLYTIAKTIQWNWHDLYGEDKFVVVMGGLDIEMACLKALGSLLKGSGWVEAVTAAGIATSGTAEALLSASHVKRCRYVHEISASALHILQFQAYELYCSLHEDGVQPLSFTMWCEKQMVHPQFAYWSIIKELQLILFTFVRSLRTSNFSLYLDSLTQLVPWFFSLDRTHYARWLSVHIRDMACLYQNSPFTLAEFMAGKFTVKKTIRNFSAMAIDQSHEQCNAAVKGDGGAIGLTQDEHALRRWMIAGPEVSRLIEEFQDGMHKANADFRHHDQRPSIQTAFKHNVNALVDTLVEMGNPFQDDSEDLVVLHSKHIVICTAADIVSIRELGQTQYEQFVQDRFVNRTVSVYAPLKRNNLSPFTTRRSSSVSNVSKRLKSTQSDCDLFSRLYIGCQTRDGSLETFFEHENQSYPPSISEFGALRFGTKADLLTCLEKVTQSTDIDSSSPTFDMMALDGAVIVQLLKPGKAKTFASYASEVFLPYVRSQIAKTQRLDLVWDIYKAQSLKTATRAKRGTGARVRVGPQVPVPHKWQEFLRDDQNKTELFQFLSEQAVSFQIPEPKIIVATAGENVLSSSSRTFENLEPCSHEEADTRLILHAYNAAKAGYKIIALRTVDTDVLVIAISVWQKMPCDQLWIAFGTGRHFRYIAVHEIANSLGPLKSKALPAFHAFTGCDTTSAFCGKGKKTAWSTWSSVSDVTDAFLTISAAHDAISDKTMLLLERFVILLYDRTADQTSVNSARQYFFTQKNWQIGNIPPTRDALMQHVKRAAYQAYVWSQTLVVSPTLPSPSDWGWKLEGSDWHPVWMTLPEADKCCPELIRCGCKTGCTTRRCKCVRTSLKCTALCSCEGECTRD